MIPWRRCAVALALLVPMAAEGQAPPSPAPAPPVKRVLSFRLHPDMAETAYQYIVNIGQPTQVVAKAGDRSYDLEVQKCGHRNHSWEQRYGWFNRSPRDVTFDGPTTVNLPACPYWRTNLPFTVPSPTAVKDLLTDATGFALATTIVSFAKMNPALGPIGPETLIPAKTDVILPYRNEWTSIELIPTFPGTPQDALQKLQAKLLTKRSEIASPTQTSQNGMFMAVLKDGDFADGGSDCRVPPTATSWPFDVTATHQAFVAALQEAQAANFVNDTPYVAVLDSNYADFSKLPLIQQHLLTSKGPVTQTSNGVYGPDTRFGSLSSASATNRDHGTMVATLALGGTDFLKLDGTTPASHVRIRTNSIQPIAATVGGDGPEVSESDVVNALGEAIARGATIANMSFEFPSEMRILESTLAANPHLLVIAAAGNEHESLESLPHNPAAMGGWFGPHALQVVTVGASEDGGHKADFSDDGPTTVDLFAPGCEVPTLDFDGKPVTATGTSMSAPLVTFVAGMLLQLGVEDPVFIKQRLLVSTDIRRDLLASSWAGGVINPVKALQLFHDYVELDNEKAPLTGPVGWPAFASWQCGDNQEVDPARVLRAVRIDPASPNANWLVIWRRDENVLLKCYAHLSGETMVLADGRSISMSMVKDFIAAQGSQYFLFR